MANTLTPVPTELLEELAAIASDHMMAETWASLTCTEAETIAAIVAVHNPTAAEALLDMHGTGDNEPDDLHHEAYLRDQADLARWAAERAQP